MKLKKILKKSTIVWERWVSKPSWIMPMDGRLGPWGLRSVQHLRWSR
jgi:hypothetical protein